METPRCLLLCSYKRRVLRFLNVHPQHFVVEENKKRKYH